ncbi:MAG: hypothetical protein JRJ39_17845 [Deltaproteobacteria bacterium]|nr:hypothetical protein [Deltaproteobacteria bacterium]
MKKRFGVLRILATVLKILGIVVAAFAVLGGLGTLIMSFVGGDMFSALGVDMNSGFFVGLISSFGIVIVGMLNAVVLYGYGELLMLLLSMEDNTFKTVKLLEDVIKDDQE